MASLNIILNSMCAAIAYGIIHDQITARISIEYFTIGHAPIIDSTSPTVLGLFWGIVATWWVGAVLGIGLAIAARFGTRRKLEATDLTRPILILMAIMFTIAIAGGCIGYFTAKNGLFHLVEPYASRVPKDQHLSFLVAGWAHSVSYLTAFIGGIILWIKTWKRRNIPALEESK